jgi:hypothetical protein
MCSLDLGNGCAERLPRAPLIAGRDRRLRFGGPVGQNQKGCRNLSVCAPRIAKVFIAKVFIGEEWRAHLR